MISSLKILPANPSYKLIVWLWKKKLNRHLDLTLLNIDTGK